MSESQSAWNCPKIALFDTHCHMDRLKTSSNILLEFSLAREKGVQQFLLPGCGLFNWRVIEEICKQEHGVYYSLGLHPYYIEQHQDDDLVILEHSLSVKSDKCVAIGECGLDFYHSREHENRQLELFVEQIKLANRYQLPLILHSRKAHQDIIALLKRYQVTSGGVIHAFTGSLQQAMDYINLGFYIGVGGAITYSRAKKTRHTISMLPLDKLVLETDAPDMPIFGYQGQQNHPKNLLMILNELNVLRSESKQTIAEQILNNSKCLYAVL